VYIYGSYHKNTTGLSLFRTLCILLYLTDDGGEELWLVVGPVCTLYNGRLIVDHQATVPSVELTAVIDAVVEWIHLTRTVLHRTVAELVWLCWNGNVLLYVVRQIRQLRHQTPVRHVGTDEDYVDGIHW